MKVLITSDWYKPTINGVVTSVTMLKEELEKRGHEVRVLTLEQKEPTPYEKGVYILKSVGAGKIYPEARINFYVERWIIEDIRKWSPDIIHSQCEFSTFLAAKKIARYKGTPIVHTYHTVYEDYTHYFSPSETIGKRTVKTLTRLILDRVDSVITPTMKVQKMLEDYDVETPIYTVPTGIDLDQFKKEIPHEKIVETKKKLNIEGEDFLLLSLGRLAKEKNITEIFNFLIKRKKDPIKMIIVGDGPYASELREEVIKMGLSDTVIFTGPVKPEETSLYYHIADLFVSASTSETQGLTYIESLASGTPALCKKDPCLEGVIENHVNGYQFENEEDFNYFLDKVRVNPCYSIYLKDNAPHSVEGLSKDAFAEKVIEVYEETLKRNAPKRTNLLEKIKSFKVIYK